MEFKKIGHWLQQERVRLARYFLIGCSAVLIDNGSYSIFTRLLHSDRRLANVVSVGIGAGFSFLLNKLWSFEQRRETTQQARRFLILFAFNYFLYQLIFWIAVHYFGFYDFAVKLIIVAAQTSWNFLLYRYWVYGVES